MPKPIYDDEECPACDGKGTAEPDCIDCAGRGRLKLNGLWEDCPACLNEPCDTCGGRRLKRPRF